MPTFAFLGSFGLPEMLIVLVLVLILFGAGKLPAVMASFGKGIKSFRDAQKDDSIDVTPKELGADKVSEMQEVGEAAKARLDR